MLFQELSGIEDPDVDESLMRKTPSPEEMNAIEERVLDIVRELAHEVGGARAQRTVTLDASLEREIGLGSLERSELLARLEQSVGQPLEDSALALDSARALARSLTIGRAATPPQEHPRRDSPQSAAHGVSASTVHESLWKHAEREPGRIHTHIHEEDSGEQAITYGRLRDEAAALAGALRELGIERGDRVALMLPTGVDFLRSFQGILLARAIPVPVYPPVRLDRLEEYATRQSGILVDAGVKMLITVRRAMGIAQMLKSRVPSLTAVTSAGELAARGASWHAPDGDENDAAFIQYTSGSTGTPKGVLLTHSNLLANIRAIRAGLQARPTDVGASWLPLYHDMGLIGSWLFCMHEGFPISILSPLAFLTHPERWLWTVHERRVTLSAAPNFAFELCVHRIPDAAIEGLDLSSWRCLLSGAEPVNPETVNRFVTRFAPYGFRREALMPVYGLAENSVALSFPPVGRAPRVDAVSRDVFGATGHAVPAGTTEANPLRFVSVGTALPEHEVRIIDDAGQELAERQVGRIVFRGPSMTSGYFENPGATEAMRVGEDWLDSGDLAYRAEGELFITGRRKDLIIKAGRNLVPQELEEIASGVPGIRKGCVAAIGVERQEQGTESVIIVAETRVTDSAERVRVADELRERLTHAVGVPPDLIQLVPPGSIPKTSSGKIRRAETKRLFLENELAHRPRRAWRGWCRLALATAASEARRLGRGLLAFLGRSLYACYLLSVLTPIAVIAWTLALIIPSREINFSLQRMFVRAGLALAGCRLSVEGLEHVPASGSALLACNHTSYVDIFILIALIPRDLLFVTKSEIRDWPGIGLFIRRAGHLSVDRHDARQSLESARLLSETVASGEAVLVFPEGTFSAAAGLRPFRLGAFSTAVQIQQPIQPIALRGTRRILRDGQWLPRPGRAELWIGPQIAPDGTDWDASLRLREQVASAIAGHCGEPRLDLVAGGHLATHASQKTEES